MTFQSFGFAITASILWCVLVGFRPNRTYRNVLLLLFSYYFYATWDLYFIPIIFGLTVFNYIMGGLVNNSKSKNVRRFFTISAAAGSIIVLMFFKYNGFFYKNLDLILHDSQLLPSSYSTAFLLPIGLSFYTFQSLSYVLDIYRGNGRVASSFTDYALFVAFFPTLLSGPLSRASSLLPQIETLHRPTQAECLDGTTLIARGLIKKMIFADNIAKLVVDPAFENSHNFSPVFLFFATFAYSAQIYMDLSGYTDMARGIAKLFGFSLMENFNRPYAARTISQFWQRWHISMSGFFRDYLYFSIGGSKNGRAYLNLMITFVVIGIWHGAGWNFVFYGVIHGAFVCYDRWRRTGATSDPEKNTHGIRVFAGIAVTLTIVSLSRILFRAEDLHHAISFTKSLLSIGHLDSAGQISAVGVFMVIATYILHYLPDSVWNRTQDHFRRLPALPASLILVAIIYTVIIFSTGSNSFIYFNF